MKAITVAVVMLGLSMAAADARADGYVSPFVGANFGGDAGGSFSQAATDRNHTTFGVDIGGMTAGAFGAEIDIAYTRTFFGTSPSFGGNSVTTIMPAAIIGIPIGGQRGAGFRPYATAGLGLLHRELALNGVNVLDGNKLGYAVGFGAMGFFSTRVGIRADYRYFRSVDVDEIAVTNIDIRRGTFNFSRGSFGVVFRF